MTGRLGDREEGKDPLIPHPSLLSSLVKSVMMDRIVHGTEQGPPTGGKIVGRRRQPRIDWEDVRRLLETAASLRPTRDLVPRGVYRFESFEEADAWLNGTIARTLARRKSATSSGSAAR